MRRIALAGTVVFAVIAGPSIASADEPRPEQYLVNGKLAAGEKELRERVAKNPNDDSLRFGLGAVQFVRALEHLGQNLYRYGLRGPSSLGNALPIVRLPFTGNRKPEALTYAVSRKIVQEWVTDFETAEATLARIKDPNVALTVPVDRIALDVAGDGSQPVTVIEVLSNVGFARGGSGELVIRFDRADVAWLRGYCHFLAALGEIALAHDGKELFDSTAQLFFSNVESPYPFLKPIPKSGGDFFADIPDLIAFVHLIRLPVVEPARMKSAHAHLLAMLSQSREMWKLALAETDDDHEWIPNPKQKGPFGVMVPQEVVDGWLAFLEEAEALLEGKRLVPFWRDSDKGVNLKRALTEARTLDLVLWVQGTAAAPFLEDGPKTRTEVWERLQRVFRGDIFLFAMWFN